MAVFHQVGGATERNGGGQRPVSGRGRSHPAALQAHPPRALFLAPMTVLLATVTLTPFLFGLYLSLTNTSPTAGTSDLVGLENFAALVADPAFWQALALTVGFTVVAVSVEVAVGMALALALADLRRGGHLVRALLLLPLAGTPVAVLYSWRIMLNPSYGVVDYLLGLVGIAPVPWLGQPGTAIASLLIVDVWQWTPFVMVILYGGVVAIPREVREAAEVDGARGLIMFRHLTVPMLMPYLGLALLFRTIDALKTFDSIAVLTSGGPGDATVTLNMLSYRQAITYLQFGKGAAAAFLLLVLTLVVGRLLVGSLYRVREERQQRGALP